MTALVQKFRAPHVQATLALAARTVFVLCTLVALQTASIALVFSM